MRAMRLAAATLQNRWVRLEPFEERHRAGLTEAAHLDVDIFRHMPFGVAEKGYGAWFDWLRAEQADGRWIPHAVIAKHPPPLAGEVASEASGRGTSHDAAHAPLRQFAALTDTSPASGGGQERIVGQSCYLAIRPEHSGVEIGGTWYTRHMQATAVNPAAKLLLIGHAFACGAERVEFKTDALNVQSRGALTKLGASFEGIFRRQMRRPDGTMRDNAYFSIIREEWEEVRAKIEARLATFT
ncbi:MAG: GNAT family N-acetyltransferase [Hyphomonadaceae bacterium]|nr:GNAT family N-acetyltransferase [Hyphomonadaceae bacterium]